MGNSPNKEKLRTKFQYSSNNFTSSDSSLSELDEPICETCSKNSFVAHTTTQAKILPLNTNKSCPLVKYQIKKSEKVHNCYQGVKRTTTLEGNIAIQMLDERDTAKVSSSTAIGPRYSREPAEHDHDPDPNNMQRYSPTAQLRDYFEHRQEEECNNQEPYPDVSYGNDNSDGKCCSCSRRMEKPSEEQDYFHRRPGSHHQPNPNLMMRYSCSHENIRGCCNQEKRSLRCRHEMQHENCPPIPYTLKQGDDVCGEPPQHQQPPTHPFGDFSKHQQNYPCNCHNKPPNCVDDPEEHLSSCSDCSREYVDLPYQQTREYLELVSELGDTLSKRNKDRVQKTMKEFENCSSQNKGLEKPIFDDDNHNYCCKKSKPRCPRTCCNYIPRPPFNAYPNVKVVKEKTSKVRWQNDPRTGEWYRVSDDYTFERPFFGQNHSAPCHCKNCQPPPPPVLHYPEQSRKSNCKCNNCGRDREFQ